MWVGVGVVAFEVPAALPPVVLVCGAVPVAPPPVVPVPPVASGVVDVPTPEPPLAETAPLAAGGVEAVLVPPEDDGVVVVEVDPAVVEVRDWVEVVTVGGVARPVVGTVKVGIAPGATVPDPPPPQAASASAAIRAPNAAGIKRLAKRRTSIPMKL